MYMCVLVIDFDCFYDFSIIFWNCSGSVAFFVFNFFVLNLLLLHFGIKFLNCYFLLINE